MTEYLLINKYGDICGKAIKHFDVLSISFTGYDGMTEDDVNDMLSPHNIDSIIQLKQKYLYFSDWYPEEAPKYSREYSLFVSWEY